MTGTVKKKAVEQNERKSKSGFSSLKKKLNIPKFYKKLASKLSIHGRHIRSLTNSWTTSDVQSLVSQYEVTGMLKELSDAAELARKSTGSVSKDLLKMQKQNYLCDLMLSYKMTLANSQIYVTTVNVNSILFCKRMHIVLPTDRLITQSLTNTSIDPQQGDDVIFKADLRHVCAKLPCDVQFKYDKHRHRLNLVTKDTGNPYLLEDILSFVCGEKLCCKRTIQSMPTGENITIPTLSSATHECCCRASISQPLNVIDNVLPKLLHLPGTNNKHEQKMQKFKEEFQSDMKDLLLSANVTGDIKLVFGVSTLLSVLSSHLRSRQPSLCCHCHSFVLAARSNFFKNIIERQKKRNEPSNCNSPFMIIELDWKVFSPRYFSVVLYAMYTDEVDLQRITKTVPVISQHLITESLSVDIQDLMELIYIGNFLEFTSLVQGCETALVNKLNDSNLIEVLHWTSEPHGSMWLRRQIIRYITENFQQLLESGILFSLTSAELIEIIKSDFVNASELDILRAVLKWGEFELIRRIELREPNLVRNHVLLNQVGRNFHASSTRHHDILVCSNTEELHKITAPLLEHVRLQHILPSNHEILNNAIKKGVISSPPAVLLESKLSHESSNDSTRATFWIHGKGEHCFRPPRLFTPHIFEAQMILEERLCQETNDPVNLKSLRSYRSSMASQSTSRVPDALYMINQMRPTSFHHQSCESCRYSHISVVSLATQRMKYIENRYPVPSSFVASSLLKRERLLRQSNWVKQILQTCHSASLTVAHTCCNERSPAANMEVTTETISLCNLCQAERHVRLIVVREYGLCDATIDVIRRPHLYYDPDELFFTSNQQTGTDTPETFDKHNITSPHEHMQKVSRQKSEVQTSKDPPLKSSAELELGSDMSLYGSAEYPFSCRSISMRSQPGSSFWESDSSISLLPVQSAVPDVAASADSSLKSARSLSGSSSDSSVSIPCRLIAESYSHSIETTGTKKKVANEKGACFIKINKSPTYTHYLSATKALNNASPLTGKKFPISFESCNKTESTVGLSSLTSKNSSSHVPPDLCVGSISVCKFSGTNDHSCNKSTDVLNVLPNEPTDPISACSVDRETYI